MALVVGIGASVAFATVAAAQSVHYSFTKVVGSEQRPEVAQTACVALNENGTVVFVTGDGSLWRGAGASLVRVAQPGPQGQPLASPCPGLNDSDAVVYTVSRASGTETVLVTQSGTVVTDLASSGSGTPQYSSNRTPTHSLSNDGVTFMAGVDDVLYLMPGATPVFAAAPSDPAPSLLVAGTMNDGHVAAFAASRLLDTSRVGIYRASGVPLVEDGHPAFVSIVAAAPVINNAGRVAFLARMADGFTHLLSTLDGQTVVDHSAGIAADVGTDFAIAADGRVVFAVSQVSGIEILTSDGSATSRVVGTGDSLDGSTVTNAGLSSDAINAAGQVSFWARLADGRTVVFRADPIRPPVASSASLSTVANTPVGGTLIASDPNGLPLIYSIRANGTRGSAVITDSSTGAFVYTPAANAIGPDTFTFEADNGTFTSNAAAVTVTIAAAGDNTTPVALPGGSGPVRSVRFDSVQDTLARTTGLPPITSFTMMGWFRVADVAGTYSAFLRLGKSTTSDGYNLLFCCDSTSSNLMLWNGATIRNAGPLTRGTWYHLALTVEGSGPGQAKVYANGRLVLTFDGNPNVTAEKFSIGNDSHLEWLNGNAAAVKVYDAPLTQPEIVTEMGRFEPVRTAGLNSWYPLQTAESAPTDFSGNDRLLSTTGPIASDAGGPPLRAAITIEGQPVDGVLQASDPDLNPLTFLLADPAGKGSAVITNASTGAYTYTPSAGATGTDTFAFFAHDGLLGSNVATVPVLILPSTFTLHVTVTGSAGAVTATPPASSCSGDCTTVYQRGTIVTLSAVPGSGSVFTGWSGACAGSAPCNVVVNGDMSASASFAPAVRDLVTTSVSDPPPSALPGSTVSVTAITTNQGTVSAAATKTRFYLSQDAVKDPADLLFSATLSVGTLNAGASATGTLTLTIPSTTPLGLYWLIACADDTALIAESSETNNCLASSRPVNVQRPDLVESSLTNPPPNIAPGGSFGITDTTQNRGAVTAPASTTRYYLSIDGLKSADDILIAVTRSVGALAAGASSTGAKTLVVPSTAPLGTYMVLACADDTISVIETDESNNCIAAAASMQVGLPDLAVSSLTALPAGATPGSSITVGDTVQNNGTAPAGASTTRYYLSNDGVAAHGVLLAATRSVGTLATGATSTGTKPVTVPASLALGPYYLVACADDLNVVTESSDTNNCLTSTGTILVGWPDLAITAISNPPIEIAPGKTFSITETVSNQGDLSAAATTTRYYLSADAIRDVNDLLLPGTRSVGILAAGAASTGSVTLTVPTTTATGTYVVLACADDLAKVAEGPNETNNCTASAASVDVKLPDLVVSSISAPPSSVIAGGTFTVADTITNQGAIAALSTTTRYYLSSGPSSVGGTLLSGVRLVGTLAAGASSAGSRVVTVPTTMTAGTYYLVACADDLKAVLESDESNNCAASPVTTIIR